MQSTSTVSISLNSKPTHMSIVIYSKPLLNHCKPILSPHPFCLLVSQPLLCFNLLSGQKRWIYYPTTVAAPVPARQVNLSWCFFPNFSKGLFTKLMITNYVSCNFLIAFKRKRIQFPFKITQILCILNEKPGHQNIF